MAGQKQIKHLWDCALSLDTETHSKKLVKSYLLKTCRKIVLSDDHIFWEHFVASQMCQGCSIRWQENEFKMKLKPQTIKIQTSKARRLIAKLKEQQKSKNNNLLTRKQKKRAQWLLKNAQSKVEIRCEFCQHRTLIPLNKSVKKTKIETPIAVETGQQKKRKRKNKDTTAGLNIPKPKKENFEAQNKTASKCSVRIEPTVTVTPAKSLQKQKNKNQSKKEVPKVISKTQKQNKLLQLAALLKSQDTSKPTSGRSTKSRLETLLE